MARKKRTTIPADVAAGVLFRSDRICCVCRTGGKSVQIHHLDGDPSNHDPINLAVLCLECHQDTQTKGGFGRKLDTEQVILYRDDWERLVATRRARSPRHGAESGHEKGNAALIASVAEAYRENEEYSLLAALYDAIGNTELRDKNIELALARDQSDYMLVELRAMQSRLDLVPPEVVAREEARYTEAEDWSQRARFYEKLGRRVDAAADYVRSALEDLQAGNPFAAAFYLKEMVSAGTLDALFLAAYAKAAEEGDLWWQVRALQELEWHDKLRALLLEHVDEIEASGDLHLLSMLEGVRGDAEAHRRIEREIAEGTRSRGGMVWAPNQATESADEVGEP